MKIRLWLALAVVLATAMALLPLLPQQIVLYVVAEGLAIVFSVMAALKSRAVWFIVAGFICFFIGDLTYVFFDLIMHTARSFPNWGDAFYLAFYPLAGIGLFKLVGKDLDSTLDSLLLILGIAIPWWLFVEYPNIVAEGYSFTEKLVTVAYPIGDIILLFLVIRALFFKLNSYLLLISAGIIALCTTDTFYSIQQLHGTFHHGSLLDYGWLAFYVLWGAAFLLPISDAPAEPLARTSDLRVGLRAVSTTLPMLSGFSILVLSTDLPNLIGAALIVASLCFVSVWRVRRLS